MESLNNLPTGKTVVFYCPFESNNCLVRTGTNDDDLMTSFISCILYACSRSFKALDNKEKNNLINKIKNTILNKINKKLWISNGLDIFKKLFKETLIDFYNFINTDEAVTNIIVKKVSKELITNKKDFDLFKIITELVPYDVFIIETEENMNIELYKPVIINTIKTYLQNLEILSEINEDNADHIIKSISRFTNVLINEVEFSSFKNYKYEVENINNIIVDEVSNYFNTNIYFVESKTRTPYVINDFNNFTNLNSIIVLSLEDKHYEIVGELTHGNIIKREFISNDPLIIKLNSIINIKKSLQKNKELDTEVSEDDTNESISLKDEETSEKNEEEENSEKNEDEEKTEKNEDVDIIIEDN